MDNGYSQAECLVKVIEEIRELVRPMGGYVIPRIKITADGDCRFPPALKITIGFSADDLTQYIAGAYQPTQCKAHKPCDQKDCLSQGKSDIHEITHALEAAGFEVYAAAHEMEMVYGKLIPCGIINIKAERAKE
jgi:hypothetical protein